MSAFKSYDIRGIPGVDFTLEDIYRIGYYLPQLIPSEKVLVGRDARNSSIDIYDALLKGLLDAGTTVHYAGLTTTPMIYYLTARYGYGLSVQITASHNPPEYNGLKISGPGAMPVGFNSGLNLIEEWIRKKPVPGIMKGHWVDVDFKPEYLNFLKRFMPRHGLRISMDASHGMAGLFLKEIFGPEVNYLYLEPDGHFPAHNPNPLDENNLHDIKSLITLSKSDLGALFDGDGDRVVFIDENGQSIPPDLIIAVLGNHFLGKEKGKVLVDIRTSRSVVEYLEALGAEVSMWKVGRAHAVPKLKEMNGIFGGEYAGHYYFRDFYYSDSGILACILALKVFDEMRIRNIRVSEFIGQIRRYHNSGEINFTVEDKVRAMETLTRHFLSGETPLRHFDFDGIRYDFKDWWYNIRPSNTEPYLRFIVEANHQELLEEKVAQARLVIQPFITGPGT